MEMVVQPEGTKEQDCQMSFDFEVEYRLGKKYGNADNMS